jgi:hypothetical protein
MAYLLLIVSGQSFGMSKGVPLNCFLEFCALLAISAVSSPKKQQARTVLDVG